MVGTLVVPPSISAGATWLVLRRGHAPLWLVLLVCLPSFAAVAAVDVVVALVRQGVIH
jgi:type III secretory pathway component EscS